MLSYRLSGEFLSYFTAAGRFDFRFVGVASLGVVWPKILNGEGADSVEQMVHA